MLGEGGGDIDPGVEDRVLGDEDEELGVASYELARELVDEGDNDEDGEEDARGGRNIDADLHSEGL